MSMKSSNRTRDLPACSEMPQPTSLARAPIMKAYLHKYNRSYCPINAFLVVWEYSSIMELFRILPVPMYSKYCTACMYMLLSDSKTRSVFTLSIIKNSSSTLQLYFLFILPQYHHKVVFPLYVQLTVCHYYIRPSDTQSTEHTLLSATGHHLAFNHTFMDTSLLICNIYQHVSVWYYMIVTPHTLTMSKLSTIGGF
jgi:hypothetical protein